MTKEAQLTSGTYRDQYGDVRWIRTGEPYKPNRATETPSNMPSDDVFTVMAGAGSRAEAECRKSATAIAPAKLCEDEGCPHFGTEHVCITRVAPADRTAAQDELKPLQVVCRNGIQDSSYMCLQAGDELLAEVFAGKSQLLEKYVARLNAQDWLTPKHAQAIHRGLQQDAVIRQMRAALELAAAGLPHKRRSSRKCEKDCRLCVYQAALARAVELRKQGETLNV